MNIKSFFQFIVGFILGTIVFSVGIAGGIYFFLSQMSLNPAKPVFSEETPKTVTKNQPSETNNKPNKENFDSTKNSNEDLEDLPAGAYRARVIWSDGLSLRAEPNKDAERIGGVGYNWELIILSDSNNKEWQRVRIPSSGQEGWIKAGNIEKMN